MDTMERSTVTDSVTLQLGALNELLVGASTHAGKGAPVTITFTGKGKLMLIGLKGAKVEWRAALMPMRIV